MRPVLLSVGGYDVYFSAFFTGLSAIAAFLYLRRRRAEAGLSVEDLWRLTLCLALGSFLGAAGLYLFLYGGGLETNLAFIARRGRIHGGSFFGALLGTLGAAWLFARARGLAFLPVADLVATGAALGLTFKRVGCLLNGCCFGRPSTLPWALAFADPRSKVRRAWLGVPLHPVQLYEAGGCVLLFLVLHYALPARRSGKPPAGAALAAFLALYGALRLALAPFRGSDPGVLTAAGLDTSQWLALGAAAAGLLLGARLRRGEEPA